MQRRAKQPVADWPIDGFSRAFRQTVEFLRARELSAMLFPQSVKAKKIVPKEPENDISDHPSHEFACRA
jgi:hypothetical protein